MNTSDWLAAAGIGISTTTLVVVGFGAIWLQHRLENLRLKRDVFRRVVSNIHSVIYDCRVFEGSHEFSENGIVAVNEIRAAFDEQEVLDAWHKWFLTGDETQGNRALVELIRAMSVACKLKHYQQMDLDEIADVFACSCIPSEE